MIQGIFHSSEKESVLRSQMSSTASQPRPFTKSQNTAPEKYIFTRVAIVKVKLKGQGLRVRNVAYQG